MNKRNIASLLAVLILCFAVLPVSAAAPVYESELVLVADDSGLSFFPADADSLFDLSKMTPGDRVSSLVAVKNTIPGFSFTLTVEISNAGKEQTYDPAELFKIEIARDGVILHTFDAQTQNYPFSYTFTTKFTYNSPSDLVFTVTLPGAETGNEYQDKLAELEFLFTANGEPPPTTDPYENTEETDPTDPTVPTEPITSSNPTEPSTPYEYTTPENTTGAETTTEPEPTTEAPTEPTIEEYTLDENETPAGTLDLTDPTDAAGITEPESSGTEEEYPDEEFTNNVPLGNIDMPKTGEPPLWISAAAGVSLIAAGLLMIPFIIRGRRPKLTRL